MINRKKVENKEKDIVREKKNNEMDDSEENQVTMKKQTAFDIPIQHIGKISKKQTHMKNGL